MRETVINPSVLTVLSSALVEGQVVRLTAGQLDRALYVQVDEVLRNLGGKWDRRQRGHVFTDDPANRLDQALLTGGYQRLDKLGDFPTTSPLVEDLVEWADISPGQHCLEPSAGQGNIADCLAGIVGPEHVYVCELQARHRAVLAAKGYWLLASLDFLQAEPDVLVGRVVMNPPFERQQDIDHVLHAWQFLEPGGVLVSVMAAGVAFRDNQKTRDFRALIESCGEIRPNPTGSFKVVGTDVNTVTVRLVKPEVPAHA